MAEACRDLEVSEVDFVEHIRAIEPFTTVEAVVEQIREDVDRARMVLAAED